MESGVLANETGFRCPDMQRLNFLPFAPEMDPYNLINISGYSGPIDRIDTRKVVNQLSGVLGNGTLYPGSGSIEELSRLFWCVKAWSLSVSLLVQVPGTPGVWSDPLNNFQAPSKVPTTFQTCFIENETDSKILVLQDIFSVTGTNQKHPLNDPSNVAQIRAHAVPADPIMTWNDLMCRGKYFSWQPETGLQTGFYTMSDPRTVTNSPFIMQFPMQGVNSDIFDPTLYPTTYGMWSLSIMNTDFICRNAAIKMPTGNFQFYTPSGSEQLDHETYALAPKILPSALIDDSGQITGYGFHPVVSGNSPVLAYRGTYDVNDPQTSGNDPAIFNPDFQHTYFPLLYFMLRLRSFPINANNVQCGFSADVCSLQPRSGWFTAGTFVIYDSNVTGYNSTVSGLSQREIFRAPLYAPGATSQLAVTVSLTPNQYWINQNTTESLSGTVNW